MHSKDQSYYSQTGLWLIVECACTDLTQSWLELAVVGLSRAQLGTQLGYFEGIWGWCWVELNARKVLTDALLELVPGGGIEPSTHGFSVRCSTD